MKNTNRKTFGIIALVVIIVFSMITCKNPTGPGGDTGTPDTGWYNAANTSVTISTPDQLAGLAQLVNEGNDFEGKTVNLGRNINLAVYAPGEGWTPIGTITDMNYFRGTFDGKGRTISGLTIDRSSEDYQGLFGIIYSGAVKDLVLSGVDITGGERVGSLAGEIIFGTVEGITSNGMVS